MNRVLVLAAAKLSKRASYMGQNIISYCRISINNYNFVRNTTLTPNTLSGVSRPSDVTCPAQTLDS